ncbi:methyltransferase domain-containing protein [Streptomyces tubbatahanensis]|uniref:Methyltransferase domain-containing protein n=1 Tax=Streptomyces tubbatahanensis TaxID=2923272 RepID=A0ABY3XLK5_9ACTN|nr:methyltransferase domain-containing protein [Streptomyces tubbatahanensis]UNS95286.1 methyltransferase domain-containing protein [Streptomyces tubbatahanensis]
MNDRTTTTPRRAAGQRRAARSWMFLKEAARDPRTTGAVAPSGRALAWALTAPVRARARRPLTVLEAGAGTGAVTRTLLAQLPADSRLDVVEANPRFTGPLRQLAGAHPRPADEPVRVRVNQGHVEEMDTCRRYDVIVSGLPLTNFSPDQAEAVMEKYLALLRPGGTLTYFAYLGTRQARTLLSSRAEARRHHAAVEAVAAYQRRYAADCRTVWANLPPARVWQLDRAPLPPAPRGSGAAVSAGR